MPLAVSGVFLIVNAVSDAPEFTRILQILVTTGYLYGYLQYEVTFWAPWLFYLLYMSIFELLLYRQLYGKWSRHTCLYVGVALIVFNVGGLETIGHGLFEHHHSYVSEFFNSVFHTPLYGVHSIRHFITGPSAHHSCW